MYNGSRRLDIQYLYQYYIFRGLKGKKSMGGLGEHGNKQTGECISVGKILKLIPLRYCYLKDINAHY